MMPDCVALTTNSIFMASSTTGQPELAQGPIQPSECCWIIAAVGNQLGEQGVKRRTDGIAGVTIAIDS